MISCIEEDQGLETIQQNLTAEKHRKGTFCHSQSNRLIYISKFIINDPSEIIRDSDVIIVVNNEEEFKNILDKAPKKKIIYDLVNINFKNKENNKNYSGIAW